MEALRSGTAHCPLPTAHSSRRGVSLMEVLISIFVLSVGLLGVAAMIPVGRYEIVEGAKADRGAALARAALREVKIRRMLEPYQYPNGTQVQMWHGLDANAPCTLIDPLYRTANASGTRFPDSYSVSMPRVNLRPYPTATVWMNAAMAEQIFVSHDDLLFNIPDDKAQRPVRVPLTGQQQFEGNYSWAVMVQYDPASLTLSLQDRTRMKVSIPVFYKRNFRAETTEQEKNGERVATNVLFTGGGLSGGDVQMQIQHPEDAKRLRSNGWLMLAAGNTTAGIIHAEWYRIVAAAQENGLVYRVTLAGPDWPSTYSNNVFAVLMEGVVNVFTETVEVSSDVFRAP